MISIDEIINLFGTPYKPKLDVKVDGVSIDSRDVLQGKVFFAIRGERTDAHRFLPTVFEKGAVAAFISDPLFLDVKNGKNIFLVDNVVEALGRLGKYYLDKLAKKDAKKIAITGSVGKTTTRHILSSVLSKKFKVFSPQKNLNTDIGVPLSLFEIPSDTDVFVFEFGADKPGDIKYLSNLIEPDIGIITSIGPAHIGKFTSIEHIQNTKWELGEYLSEKEGILIYNRDNSFLSKKCSDYKGKAIGFGSLESADVRLINYNHTLTGEEFTVFFNKQLIDIKIPLFGIGNIYNTLSIIGLAPILSLDIAFLKDALFNIPPINNRLSLKKVKDYDLLIIDDTYNSNPSSLRNSLEVVSRFSDRKKIAVLGDMLELGRFSKVYHREIGRDIALHRWVDELIGIGKDMEFLIHGAEDYGFKNTNMFKDKKRLVSFLLDNLDMHSVYLFKASRSIGLEEVVSEFIKKIRG